MKKQGFFAQPTMSESCVVGSSGQIIFAAKNSLHDSKRQASVDNELGRSVLQNESH
jgi:hypothetical protein